MAAGAAATALARENIYQKCKTARWFHCLAHLIGNNIATRRSEQKNIQQQNIYHNIYICIFVHVYHWCIRASFVCAHRFLVDFFYFVQII